MAKYSRDVYEEAQRRLDALKQKRMYEGLDEEEVSLLLLLQEVLATQ